MNYQLLKKKSTGDRFVRVTAPELEPYEVYEKDNPEEYMKLRKRVIANRNRRERDECLRSLGLTKVRGSVSGKTYWE